MAKILLFKNFSPMEVFNSDRDMFRTFNLIPFKSIKHYYSGSFAIIIAHINVFGNILIFIPFGIYLQLYLKDKSILKSFVITLISSVIIEVVQFAFGIGIADIDDVILNTVGGLIGILIYKILVLVFKSDDSVENLIICMVAVFAVLYVVIMAVASYMGIKVRIL